MDQAIPSDPASLTAHLVFVDHPAHSTLMAPMVLPVPAIQVDHHTHPVLTDPLPLMALVILPALDIHLVLSLHQVLKAQAIQTAQVTHQAHRILLAHLAQEALVIPPVPPGGVSCLSSRHRGRWSVPCWVWFIRSVSP